MLLMLCNKPADGNAVGVAEGDEVGAKTTAGVGTKCQKAAATRAAIRRRVAVE